MLWRPYRADCWGRHSLGVAQGCAVVAFQAGRRCGVWWPLRPEESTGARLSGVLIVCVRRSCRVWGGFASGSNAQAPWLASQTALRARKPSSRMEFRTRRAVEFRRRVPVYLSCAR